MEFYIQISKINDFTFCPYSLYYHSIYEGFSEKTYHASPQTRGKIKHENIDKGKYSSSKRYLQGLEVFSEKYGLCGKIDIYDQETKTLIERKNKIVRVYDGYLYQLYAQYFALKEMGYNVKKIKLHSLTDNKHYDIIRPAGEKLKQFKKTMQEMLSFNPAESKIKTNENKCDQCIYKQLCAYAVN